MPKSIGTILINLEANTNKLVTDFNKAEKTVSKTVGNMKTAIVSLTGAYLSMQGVNAFSSMIKGSIDAADKTAKLAQKLSLSTNELSRLEYASGFADVSMGQLNASMGAMIRRANNFKRDGTGAASKAMKELGISSEFAQKNFTDTNTTFMILLDRLSKIPDGFKKTAIAQDLFSKSAADVVRLANMGTKEIKRLGDEGERIGAVFSNDFAKNAEKLNDNLYELGKITEGISIKMATKLVPGLISVTNNLKNNKEAIETLGDMSESVILSIMYGFEGVANVIIGGMYVYDTLETTIEGIGSTASYTFLYMKKEYAELIAFMQTNTNNLPNFLKEKLGVDDNSVKNALIDVVKIEQAMTKIELKAQNRLIKHYDYAKKLNDYRKLISTTIDSYENPKPLETKQKNNDVNINNSSSNKKIKSTHKKVKEDLSMSANEWIKYYEVIGNYENAWLIKNGIMSAKFKNLTTEQFLQMSKIAKKEYFDKINKEIDTQQNKLSQNTQNILDGNYDLSELEKLNNQFNEIMDDISFNLDDSEFDEAYDKLNTWYKEQKEKIESNPIEFNVKLNLDSTVLSETGLALQDVSNTISTIGDEQKQWNSYFDKYSKKSKHTQKEKEEFNKNEKQHNQNQLAGYANLAGTMSKMYAEGSAQNRILQDTQTALSVAAGITAIANAMANGDGYTAIARGAAVAAALSSYGWVGGGGGSVVSSTNYMEKATDTKNYNSELNNSIKELNETFKLDIKTRQTQLLQYNGNNISLDIDKSSLQDINDSFASLFSNRDDANDIYSMVVGQEKHSKRRLFRSDKTWYTDIVKDISGAEAHALEFLSQFGVDKNGLLTSEGISALNEATSSFSKLAETLANNGLDKLQIATKDYANIDIESLRFDLLKNYANDFEKLGLNLYDMTYETLDDYFNNDILNQLISVDENIILDDLTASVTSLNDEYKNQAELLATINELKLQENNTELQRLETLKDLEDKIEDVSDATNKDLIKAFDNVLKTVKTMIGSTIDAQTKLGAVGLSGDDALDFYISQYHDLQDEFNSYIDEDGVLNPAYIDQAKDVYNNLLNVVDEIATNDTLVGDDIFAMTSSLNDALNNNYDVLENTKDVLNVNIVATDSDYFKSSLDLTDKQIAQFDDFYKDGILTTDELNQMSFTESQKQKLDIVSTESTLGENVEAINSMNGYLTSLTDEIKAQNESNTKNLDSSSFDFAHDLGNTELRDLAILGNFKTTTDTNNFRDLISAFDVKNDAEDKDYLKELFNIGDSYFDEAGNFNDFTSNENYKLIKKLNNEGILRDDIKIAYDSILNDVNSEKNKIISANTQKSEFVAKKINNYDSELKALEKKMVNKIENASDKSRKKYHDAIKKDKNTNTNNKLSYLDKSYINAQIVEDEISQYYTTKMVKTKKHGITTGIEYKKVKNGMQVDKLHLERGADYNNMKVELEVLKNKIENANSIKHLDSFSSKNILFTTPSKTNGEAVINIKDNNTFGKLFSKVKDKTNELLSHQNKILLELLKSDKKRTSTLRNANLITKESA